MSDYNETTISGKSWQRCNEIRINNPRCGPPSVDFVEERVIVADSESRQALGVLTVAFDPARTFALRDPTTGEMTGSYMTYGEAYAVLYSAYINAALVRDADAVRPEPELPEA